jgi:hypothetical protein
MTRCLKPASSREKDGSFGSIRSEEQARTRGNLMVQLRPLIEELLVEERDRQVAQFAKQERKVARWGYTVRKFWRTPWGVLKQVRIPRLRDGGEIGLMEKYRPQSAPNLGRAERWQKEFLEYWAVWAFFLTAAYCISSAPTGRP